MGETVTIPAFCPLIHIDATLAVAGGLHTWLGRTEEDTMRMFTVGETVNHRVGDHACPVCAEAYPEPCRCGGLMHAAPTGEEDADGNSITSTLCDSCGRSEDQLDEV